MAFIMTLLIGSGAILKRSSQWQLKEFLWTELFNFQTCFQTY